MAKKQRVIQKRQDRLTMTTTEEFGKRVRKVADAKNLTISRLMAEIIEPAIEEMEREMDLLSTK